jgi:hypothetical protein
VLKELFAAAMALADIPIPEDAAVPSARRALDALAASDRQKLIALVTDITIARSAVNLSRWARSLARSADRTGMLLCGDPVVAAKAVATLGVAGAVDDLLDWTTGPDHLALRGELGLSIDV